MTVPDTDSMQPLVSILIPCFNAAPWVAQCIRSALDQTYPNKEIIVLDDGSTDASLEVIRTFGDRVRFETGPNRGGNAARNRLMALSSGTWLEFLDADDFLLPDKIARQMEVVGRQPEADVVYSPVRDFYADTGVEVIDPVIDEDVFANYFRWTYFSTTALLWRRDAVAAVGGWKEDQPVCQEHELVLRLLAAGKRFALLPEALGVNRHQNVQSVSKRSPLRTLTARVDLMTRCEHFLRGRNELTEVRRLALAGALYQMARSAYREDRSVARQLAARAASLAPIGSCPHLGRLYRLAFRVFGLDGAECLSSLRQVMRGRGAAPAPPPGHVTASPPVG
jgi:GT2 family glycosyltransferase